MNLLIVNFHCIRNWVKEFPGSPVVRTHGFHCQGPGSIPGQRTKIPQIVQYAPPPKKRVKTIIKQKLLLGLSRAFLMSQYLNHFTSGSRFTTSHEVLAQSHSCEIGDLFLLPFGISWKSEACIHLFHSSFTNPLNDFMIAKQHLKVGTG